MNLDIEYNNDKIILKNIKNFDLKQTLECGQCFRWEKVKENNYIGIAYERVIEVEQKDDNIIFYNTCREDFDNIWKNYFDLNRDYNKVKKELSKDKILKKAMEFGYGIRVLNQEPFELVISFIISARNSIPVITSTIKHFAKLWGREIEYKGNIYYTFPTAEKFSKLTEEEVKAEGGSFRSKYIVDTSKKIYKCRLINEENLNIDKEKEFLEKYDLKYIMSKNDNECHQMLQNYSGVGAKVADCIMLFSMGKTSAFPVDVWVKRAMMYFYGVQDVSLPKIRLFAREKFGDLSGFAQQYLFYYTRVHSIK
ncbi:MAG: DNA-3-methyladenine glycosylase family protein [Sarcina sp.]